MKKRTILSCLLLLAAALLTAVGMDRGQPALVMGKAIRICLECVGIG